MGRGFSSNAAFARNYSGYAHARERKAPGTFVEKENSREFGQSGAPRRQPLEDPRSTYRDDHLEDETSELSEKLRALEEDLDREARLYPQLSSSFNAQPPPPYTEPATSDPYLDSSSSSPFTMSSSSSYYPDSHYRHSPSSSASLSSPESDVASHFERPSTRGRYIPQQHSSPLGSHTHSGSGRMFDSPPTGRSYQAASPSITDSRPYPEREPLSQYNSPSSMSPRGRGAPGTRTGTNGPLNQSFSNRPSQTGYGSRPLGGRSVNEGGWDDAGRSGRGW